MPSETERITCEIMRRRGLDNLTQYSGRTRYDESNNFSKPEDGAIRAETERKEDIRSSQ